MKLNTSD